MDCLNDKFVSNFSCSGHKSFFESYFAFEFRVKNICIFIQICGSLVK